MRLPPPANRNTKWITDGQRNRRIDKKAPLPKGWSCGHTWHKSSKERGIAISQGMRAANPPIKLFWKYVRKTKSCWLWQASLNDNGYGRFSTIVNGRDISFAHRFSWFLHFGDPGSLFVLHKCDNPQCVRPDHLFLGTQADNMADCRAKGRQPGSNGKCRGENSSSHKLTWDDVRYIRSSAAHRKELALLFNVSTDTITLIRQNKTWVEEPHQ